MKHHISASRVTTYSDCGLKYKFNYIDKLGKFVSSIHLVYGSAIHEALEHFNISMGQTVDQSEDVFQAFHDAYQKGLEKEGLEKDYFRWTLYEMGINSLQKFLDEFVDYTVIATEQKFNVPLIWADGTVDPNYDLLGFIDAVIKRKNGEIVIVDYKTSKEAYPKFNIDTSLQLTMYSYAFRHLLNEGKFPNIKKKKEDFIGYCVIEKDYKTLNGPIKMQRKKIGDVQLNKMFYTLRQYIFGIESSLYMPNYNSLCKWCDYKKECVNFEG